MTNSIQHIAIVGTGVIGSSWATAFLARGIDVTASDPAPGAEAALRRTVEAQWPAMEQIGLASGASVQRLRFEASLEEAVAKADFVQENGPERLDVKREVFIVWTKPPRRTRSSPPARQRSRSASSKTPARGIPNASCSVIPSIHRT